MRPLLPDTLFSVIRGIERNISRLQDDVRLALCPPCVRVRASTQVGINSGGEILLLWDTEDYDSTGDMHDTSVDSGRLYARRDGIYHVSLACKWKDDPNFPAERRVEIYKNDTSTGIFPPSGAKRIAVGNQLIESTTSLFAWTLAQTDIDMVAGDWVSAFAFQDSGGSINIHSGIGGKEDFFAMHYVGRKIQ